MNANRPEPFQRQAEMLANRVKKRFNHLSSRFSKRNIDIFRLYDWDIPEIRAVVDWYGGHLVIGEYMRRQSAPQWLPLMGRAVAEALNVPANQLHLKQRWAGARDGRRYERIDHTDRKIVLSERDLKFLVNPWDYVDTGLFADHRETRKMVRGIAAGKDFLNLYGYTGSFSCYAARGGARTTVSVDRSEGATQWARENLILNDLDLQTNTLVQAHVFDFLNQARSTDQRFDLAVVDPPSYSSTKTRNVTFDVVRDHPRLLEMVIERLRPGGTLFFSTNHQDFELRRDAFAAADVKEITAATIPEDYRNPRKTIHRCWRINV